MSSLRVPSHAPDARGSIVAVTPESAGWTYVGFEVVSLGGRLERSSPDRETCVVVLSGSCDMATGDESWIGLARTSVFEEPPVAVYVPPRTPWSAEGDARIAICMAPAEGRFAPRLLDQPVHVVRGEDAEERRIANILMESEEAESLLVCEAFTPAGHWSSWPPHKHDTNDPPRETQLEETYYHLLSPADGFAFQRVYNDDRSLDEAIAVENGDVVLVPRGYHPVAAGPRHDLYYLNVMAGPVRAWHTTTAPEFA